MSAVYTLTNTTDQWYDAVTALCREANEPSMLRVTANAEAVVSPDRPLQRESFSSDDGELHLFPEGGIRGVVLKPSTERDGECVLRFNVLASAGDWSLGFRILRDAIADGVTVKLADKEIATAEELTEAAATEQQKDAWTTDQAAIAKRLDHATENPEREVEGHSAMLPFMGRAIMVSREELNLSADELAALLIARAHRYATAYEASLMSFPAPKGMKGPKGKPGQPVYLANFPHFAALIPKQVQGLTFHGASGNVVDAFVPLSTFMKHLGDRVEDAGEFHYVPAIDFSTIPDVVAEFEKVQGAVDAPPKGLSRMVSANVRQMIFSQQTTGEEIGDEPELIPRDWEFLKTIPSLVFLFVGGADGSITKDKRVAFGRVLDRFSRDGAKHGETMQRMIGLTQDDFDVILQRLTTKITHPRFYAETFGKLRVMVDRKLPEDEATKVKAGCVEMAKKVALSSGRMFGAKVTPEEKAAVNVVQQALGT